jgi:glycosyltransferase involved in cell wall biosynthesis
MVKEETISIIVPAYNESAGISNTIIEISNKLKTININYEIIIVDDGSNDNTIEVVANMMSKVPELSIIKLSRNFGKESAILAGLRLATGNAIITMDADLQHPVSLFPSLIDKWREGAKVVHAIKKERKGDSVLTKLRASAFNKMLTKLSGLETHGASDYKLLDKSIVDVLINNLPERKRFYRGLATWVGYTQDTVEFDVEERKLGTGKWSVGALIDLAATGIVSFTTLPLRIVTILGAITMILAVIIAADALWSWAMGTAISGFATTIITLLIIGSFIMISLGILGEYVGKIYEEIKARPEYLVEQVIKGKSTQNQVNSTKISSSKNS